MAGGKSVKSTSTGEPFVRRNLRGKEGHAMKFNKALLLLILLVCVCTSNSLAQDSQSAAQTAGELRAHLQDVQAEEAELKTHLERLDWDLKPENIERYFAAVGTTRPEELREQRRRQLQNEKERAESRLSQLGAARIRLESAISTADAEAYIQSA